ncbi:MAG TPA: DUF5916 domain-containing protein [Thermoanaerobaculia bacterium]
MKRIVALAALFWLGAALDGQEPSRFVVTAPRLSSAPTIDGNLDEQAWSEAAALDSFTQLEPTEGAPASEATEVRIGYDAKTLYVAVRCHDSQKVTSVLMDRDGELANEDSVQIVLDTFLDKRSGFLFAVNPLGAQFDALVRGEGEEVNFSWDGIWTSATARDGGGWSAELAIPFRTVRFPAAEEQTWGLNVQRTVISKREYTLWKPIDRYSSGLALFKLSQAGELKGLRDLEQGRRFDLKPYVAVRGESNSEAGDDTSLDAGIDVKKNLTSELVLDLTYNLDFAEAEADNQQVNLSRFKLFFPEKRDFFLEGSSLFYFGERPDYLKSPERIFFFSRQIGLTADARQEIPVLGGAKVAGKVGGFDLGFLNLTTEELTYRDRDGEERFEPETNYTVLRVKRDLFAGSSVGVMGLNKEVSGGPDNEGAGVDWDFALGKSVKTGGFLARTRTPGLEGEDWAAQTDLVFDSKYVFAKGAYTEVGEDFNPEMGFFTRTGVREYRGNVTFLPRPKIWKLRDMIILDDFTQITDREGELREQYNRAEVDLQWQNYVVLAMKYFSNVEVLDASFEIYPGVVIPPGRYDYSNYFVGIQSIPGKPFFAFGRILGGDLYDGTFNTYFVGARIRPLPGLFSRITYEHTDVKLPAGDFIAKLLSVKVIYSLSPRLSTRALLEWRNDDNLSVNAALKWTYKPGAAFYVVYDELQDLVDRPPGVPNVRDRSLIVKSTFFF